MFNCASSESDFDGAEVPLPEEAPRLVALSADGGLAAAGARHMLEIASVRLPGIAPREATVLNRLAAAEIDLALMTEASHGMARSVCNRRGIRPFVLSDQGGAVDIPAQGGHVPRRARAAARAERLARLCQARGIPFSRVAVVAVSPLDTAALMEAGWAIALRDASYEACRAADVVLPSRSEGGLVQAIELILSSAL